MIGKLRPRIVHSSLASLPDSLRDDQVRFPDYPPRIGVVAGISFDRAGNLHGEICLQSPRIDATTAGERLIPVDQLDDMTRGAVLAVATHCRDTAAEMIRQAERLEALADKPAVLDDLAAAEAALRSDAGDSVTDAGLLGASDAIADTILEDDADSPIRLLPRARRRSDEPRQPRQRANTGPAASAVASSTVDVGALDDDIFT